MRETQEGSPASHAMHNSDAAFSTIAGKWIYHIRMSAEIRRAKQGRQAMSYSHTPLFANMCVCRLGRSSSHQSEHRATLQQQVVEGREGELFLWLARLRKYSGGAVPESMSCDLDAPRLPCLMLKEVFALIQRRNMEWSFDAFVPSSSVSRKAIKSPRVLFATEDS